MEKNRFEFDAALWVYPGPAAWYFATLPRELSEEIDFYYGHMKAGWGSLPVEVRVGGSVWRTSIFPDKKAGSYMLPVKREIREKEDLRANTLVKVFLVIRK